VSNHRRRPWSAPGLPDRGDRGPFSSDGPTPAHHERWQGATVDAERVRAELLLDLRGRAAPGLDDPAARRAWAVERPDPQGVAPGQYAERSRLLHKESTAGVFESYVRYLIFYLGDRPLDEVARPETLHGYVERRLQDALLSFALAAPSP